MTWSCPYRYFVDICQCKELWKELQFLFHGHWSDVEGSGAFMGIVARLLTAETHDCWVASSTHAINVDQSGAFFRGGGVRHCAGAGRARLGSTFCIRVNTTLDLGRGRVECMELHITFQFVSTKASFASLFWDTLHAASYHPLGSSKLGAPSPSSVT